jgi:hypothetical protein
MNRDTFVHNTSLLKLLLKLTWLNRSHTTRQCGIGTGCNLYCTRFLKLHTVHLLQHTLPTSQAAYFNRCLRPRTDTSNGTCNVMRILRLDVTAIIACNIRRMVRSDPSPGGFFLEHKGFRLGSQYTFDVFQRVCVCGRVLANKESSGNEYLSVQHVRNDWADPRIRGCIRSALVCGLYNLHYKCLYAAQDVYQFWKCS